jgi:hypothetical protein
MAKFVVAEASDGYRVVYSLAEPDSDFQSLACRRYERHSPVAKWFRRSRSIPFPLTLLRHREEGIVPLSASRFSASRQDERDRKVIRSPNVAVHLALAGLQFASEEYPVNRPALIEQPARRPRAGTR